MKFSIIAIIAAFASYVSAHHEGDDSGSSPEGAHTHSHETGAGHSHSHEDDAVSSAPASTLESAHTHSHETNASHTHSHESSSNASNLSSSSGVAGQLVVPAVFGWVAYALGV